MMTVRDGAYAHSAKVLPSHRKVADVQDPESLPGCIVIPPPPTMLHPLVAFPHGSRSALGPASLLHASTPDGTLRSLSQAHLGVRLKKMGCYVIGADWKKQEYFEEVQTPGPFHT